MDSAAIDASPYSEFVSGLPDIPITANPSSDPSARLRPAAPDLDLTRADTKTETTAPVTASSYINRVSLFGIAQLLNLESKSCVVEATLGAQRGKLVFLNGDLIDAESGDVQGNSAVETMLGWQTPTVWIHETNATTRVTVTKPVTQLLLQSMRALDESRYAQTEIVLPSEDSATRAELVAEAGASLAALMRPRGVLAVALIDGRTKTILAQATDESDFAGELMITEIANASAFHLLANGLVDEISVGRKGSRSVIVALDVERDVFLYVAMTTTLANPGRILRRITKQASRLIA